MKQKKSLLVLGIAAGFMAVLFLPGLIGAGDLDPANTPGPTMHTLEEIYNKLDQLIPGNGLASVEKTGQTTSFATGDDGDLQMGIPWPALRFTDNEDGTVTDNLTGLIWLTNADCFGQKPWTLALSAAKELASGSCDLTDGSRAGDWRLPNVKELQSLIDFGEIFPALPIDHPFTNVQSHYYWSSTTYVGNTLYAWTVYMYDGFVNYHSKANYYYVWPVRGGN